MARPTSLAGILGKAEVPQGTKLQPKQGQDTQLWSCLCHLLMWPWARHFPSLGLSALIRKIRVCKDQDPGWA